jgi:hypothetical protein
MRRVLFLLVATASVIIAIGLLSQRIQIHPPQKRQIKVGNVTLYVEIADSEDERKKGLSGTKSLPENEGMLFSFGQENVLPSFWMKGMLIPIDIIWIDEWEVVKIHENIQPEPEKSDSELTKYYPDGPVDLVIEVNAGFSGKNNIRVGDNILIYRD